MNAVVSPHFQCRSLTLKNILLPINIVHGHLPGDRMPADQGASRIDVLEIEVHIDYSAHHLPQDLSLNGVFSYGGIYSMLCEGPIRTVTSPLESVLDDIIESTEKLAVDQDIELHRVKVSAERRGLDVGRPVMVAQRCYHSQSQVILNSARPLRSSGFQNLPVQIVIHHDWTSIKDRIEHVPHRHETVLLSFNVTTESKPLDPDSLEGLFNYVTAHQSADANQGEEISGPLELITDRLMTELEEECYRQGLKPLLLECSIQRTGFTRCVPVIGLRKMFPDN